MGCGPSKHPDRRVVIVGGGYAGTTVAKALDGQFEVVLVERQERMMHVVGQIRAVVDLDFAEGTLIPYDGLLKSGTVKQAAVTEIYPDRVVVEGGSDIVIREEDFLVIATGSSSPAPGRFAGLTFAEMRASQREGFETIRDSSKIVIVGGGPVGVELAGEIRDAYPGKDITIVHRGPYLCSGKNNGTDGSVLPAKLGVSLQEVCTALRITVKTGTAVEFEGAMPAGMIKAPAPLKLSDGTTIDDADLAIWVTGIRPNNSAFATTMADKLDAAGRIRVGPSMLVPGLSNVFALGDCAEAGGSKTAYHAGAQASIVSKNIAALAAGKAPASLSKYAAGTPAMVITVGAAHGRGQLPFCGGIGIGDGMVSSIKGKDLFTSQFRADLGAPAAAASATSSA